jgi:hypothetical protein
MSIRRLFEAMEIRDTIQRPIDEARIAPARSPSRRYTDASSIQENTVGIFGRHRKGQRPPLYKILVIAEDGETLYWWKRGAIHLVEEDVARHFVRGFQPKLFEVTADGGLQPPEAGVTKPIRRVEMVAVDGA